MFRNVVCPIICLLMLISATKAEEKQLVELKINGLTALGDLVVPEGTSIKTGVVLLIHGTLAHKDMELIEALQKILAARGIASLAPTLTLDIDRRTGMYDCKRPHTHKHSDAQAEIAAWIKWLKQRGATNITLLGHSRGGPQVATFATMASRDISKAVLMAPRTAAAQRNTQTAYKQNFGGDLKKDLQSAAEFIRNGEPNKQLSLPGFLYCKNAKASAESLMSYYGPDQITDLAATIRNTNIPVLIIAASEDKVVPDLQELVKPIVDGKRIYLEVIEGADHMFLDFYAEDAADKMIAFLGVQF